MKAADIMTREVVAVTVETTIEEAARLMLQHRISGLPVTGPGGIVVGVVTEGDLLRRAETGTERRHPRWLEFLLSPGSLAQSYVRSHARQVGEVMTSKVFSVAPTASLEEIVELMERRRVKRVPVLEENRLVGIVSRANLLAALASLLGKGPAGAVADDEIRRRILAELDKQPWVPRASLEIAVADGVVELRGAVTDNRERDALRVAAGNVPGVKEVRDRLAWIEPISGLVIDTPDAARKTP